MHLRIICGGMIYEQTYKMYISGRDSGVIAYSQVGAKIYYRFSDIEDLLNKNHIKAKEKNTNRKL